MLKYLTHTKHQLDLTSSLLNQFQRVILLWLPVRITVLPTCPIKLSSGLQIWALLKFGIFSIGKDLYLLGKLEGTRQLRAELRQKVSKSTCLRSSSSKTQKFLRSEKLLS